MMLRHFIIVLVYAKKLLKWKTKILSIVENLGRKNLRSRDRE